MHAQVGALEEMEEALGRKVSASLEGIEGLRVEIAEVVKCAVATELNVLGQLISLTWIYGSTGFDGLSCRSCTLVNQVIQFCSSINIFTVNIVCEFPQKSLNSIGSPENDLIIRNGHSSDILQV